MPYVLRMPTDSELAEISSSELNTCIRLSFQEWQEAFRMKDDTTERKRIFKAFDDELLKRIDQLKKQLTY